MEQEDPSGNSDYIYQERQKDDNREFIPQRYTLFHTLVVRIMSLEPKHSHFWRFLSSLIRPIRSIHYDRSIDVLNKFFIRVYHALLKVM